MSYKILFADDSKMINEVMVFAFEDDEFEIQTCISSGEIELKTKTTKYDIIILSYELDGINLGGKIKLSEINKNALVYILSKESDTNLKKMAKDNNIDGWITKPFIPEQLVKTLKFQIIKNYKPKK